MNSVIAPENFDDHNFDHSTQPLSANTNPKPLKAPDPIGSSQKLCAIWNTHGSRRKSELIMRVMCNCYQQKRTAQPPFCHDIFSIEHGLPQLLPPYTNDKTLSEMFHRWVRHACTHEYMEEAGYGYTGNCTGSMNESIELQLAIDQLANGSSPHLERIQEVLDCGGKICLNTAEATTALLEAKHLTENWNQVGEPILSQLMPDGIFRESQWHMGNDLLVATNYSGSIIWEWDISANSVSAVTCPVADYTSSLIVQVLTMSGAKSSVQKPLTVYSWREDHIHLGVW